MDNPLNTRPKIRKVLQVVQYLTNGGIVVATVVLSAMGVTPDEYYNWWIGFLAGAPALWTYLGYTSSQNIQIPQDPAPDHLEV